MKQKILVAFDGSEYANQAYADALELARLYKAEVFVLSAIKLPEPLIETDIFIATATKYYNDKYSAIKDEISCDGLNVHFAIVVGDPAEEIVNFAESNQIDLIVIGVTKDSSAINRFVLGSVSRKVVDLASCSVTIVR